MAYRPRPADAFGVIKPQYRAFEVRPHAESREDRVIRAEKVDREKALRRDRRAAASHSWS